MTIGSTGRIGINNPTPVRDIDINGFGTRNLSLEARGDTIRGMRMVSDIGLVSRIYQGGSGSGANSGGLTLEVANRDLTFFVNGAVGAKFNDQRTFIVNNSGTSTGLGHRVEITGGIWQAGNAFFATQRGGSGVIIGGGTSNAPAAGLDVRSGFVVRGSVGGALGSSVGYDSTNSIGSVQSHNGSARTEMRYVGSNHRFSYGQTDTYGLELNSNGEVLIRSSDNGDYTLQANGNHSFNSAGGESYFGTTSDAGDFRVQVNGRHYIESPAYSNTSDVPLVINQSSGAGPGINLRTGNSGRITFITNYNASNSSAILVGTATNNPTGQAMFFDHSNAYVGIRSTVANYPLTITDQSTQSLQQFLLSGRPTTAANGFLIGVQRIGSDTLTAILKNQENYPMIFYTNNTDRARFKADGEMLIGYTADQGAYILQANGNGIFNGSLTTSAPNGGTAASWKLGIVVAGSYTAASNYLQVDVGGTLYYIGLVTPD
jgi:hypothetical protein